MERVRDDWLRIAARSITHYDSSHLEGDGGYWLTAAYGRYWLPRRTQPRRSVLQTLHEAEAAERFQSGSVL